MALRSKIDRIGVTHGRGLSWESHVLANKLLGVKAALRKGCLRARAIKHGHTDKSEREEEALYGGGG